MGGTSGAVSVAAHALGGGALPAQGPAVLLVAAAIAAGVLAAATRLPVVATLVAGQLLGHATLTLDAGHTHLPGAAMLAAHAAAVAVAAVLIRGAEHGCRVALGALRRLTPRPFVAAEIPAPVVRPVSYRPRTRRVLLPAAGLATRGPPAVTV